MKKEIQKQKTEDVKVLDNGIKVNEEMIILAFCCGGAFIPLRS